MNAGNRTGATGQDVQTRDRYWSRCGSQPELAPREEPVVYGGGSPAGALPIDLERIAEFEKDGYLFLPSLFSVEEAAVLATEMERIREDRAADAGEELIQERGSGVPRSLFRIHAMGPVFSALAADSRIVDIVRFILGGDVYIHQSRVNFKPAFSGRDFYWHSDFETWHVEDGMPRMRALSVSVLLTESSEFNGALMLIPGSHKTYVRCVGETPDNHYKQSLRRQEYGVPDQASLSALAGAGGIRLPKGPAGSVLMFDCNMMHGSSSNISPYPRSSIFYVYNSIENRLDAPYSGKAPRPEFVATRNEVERISPRAVDYSRIPRSIPGVA